MAYFKVLGSDGTERDIEADLVSQVGDRVVFQERVECLRTVCEVPGGEVAEVRRRIVADNMRVHWVLERYPIVERLKRTDHGEER